MFKITRSYLPGGIGEFADSLIALSSSLAAAPIKVNGLVDLSSRFTAEEAGVRAVEAVVNAAMVTIYIYFQKYRRKEELLPVATPLLDLICGWIRVEMGICCCGG